MSCRLQDANLCPTAGSSKGELTSADGSAELVWVGGCPGASGADTAPALLGLPVHPRLVGRQAWVGVEPGAAGCVGEGSMAESSEAAAESVRRQRLGGAGVAGAALWAARLVELQPSSTAEGRAGTRRRRPPSRLD